MLLGSNKALHTDWESPSQRALLLANKWRAVWRMSVDRKKRLQDCLDALREVIKHKNSFFFHFCKTYFFINVSSWKILKILISIYGEKDILTG